MLLPIFSVDLNVSYLARYLNEITSGSGRLKVMCTQCFLDVAMNDSYKCSHSQHK